MRIRKPFRIKEIDVSYCMNCRWNVFAPHSSYDFCRYDGLPCVHNAGFDFKFTCKHFEPIPNHILDSFLISLNTKHFKLCLK